MYLWVSYDSQNNDNFFTQNQPVGFVKAIVDYELKLVRWKIPGTDGTQLRSKRILFSDLQIFS